MQTRFQIEFDPDQLAAFCKRWKIDELALFGSVLREDFRPDSDIDFLVTFEPGARWSLFDLARMQAELEEMFGRPVDLVEREAVEKSSNYIRRKSILCEVEVVYAAG
jgi:uncharacterized protein